MFVLGSSSPRRKKLMGEDIAHSFIIDPSEIDESSSLFFKPLKSVKDIAKRKGIDVSKKHPNDIVITADTIVVINKQILVKPKDENDAFKMLKLLSNKTHKVITAYYIYTKEKQILNYDVSFVKFNKLSDQTILDYIKTKSPMDKAGAYGYQDNEKFHLIKNIKGSVKNVIGFPSEKIIEDLHKLNIKF